MTAHFTQVMYLSLYMNIAILFFYSPVKMTNKYFDRYFFSSYGDKTKVIIDNWNINY